jgi:1-acyl-sn-glycerol-3-phosphate acyltransferase
MRRQRVGEPTDRIGLADGTRPTTAVAAFPGGVVPDDIP